MREEYGVLACPARNLQHPFSTSKMAPQNLKNRFFVIFAGLAIGQAIIGSGDEVGGRSDDGSGSCRALLAQEDGFGWG